MEQIDTIVQVTTHIVRRAAEIKTIYGLQFYDAQIIAAAEKAGCDEVWSEDMGDGQTYCGVKCVNPFAADFTGLGE
jgi:predicted nucleic acid-binding protein